MHVGVFNEYKGYKGSINTTDDGDFIGRIINTNDFVNYEAETLEDLEREFHLAVDDYIDMLKYEKQVEEELEERNN